MSIAKPFTFTANTYAKASEVNANFDVVYGQVNTNISAIAQNATDIDNLENNKANINGSYAQRFAVADPVNSNEAVNKGYMLTNGLPVGFILHVALSEAPSGYLICDGSEVSRVTYANLFAAIGTTFGAGDGNTTFNIPDLITYPYIKGSSTIGTELEAGLPNITGNIGITKTEGYNTLYNASGALYDGGSQVGGQRQNSLADGDWIANIRFDASRSSSIYSNDVTTVQPASLTLLPIIKY